MTSFLNFADAASPLVAYFSMEIALANAMPTYSGGLGVLAGDTIRAAADLKLPMVAISLLYRQGNFNQLLDADGNQTASPVEWRVEEFLHEEPQRVTVPFEDRHVELRCWSYVVRGIGGFEIPVYFLDSDLPSNHDSDRELTGTLYGGDAYYRLCQELLLGIGGLRMLRALGHPGPMRYHMNEGHAALLTLELLAEEAAKAGRTRIHGEDIEKVRASCIFTTHTPVPAGHDRFPVQFLTHLFPNEKDFFDLKDPAVAAFVKRVLAVDAEYKDMEEAAAAGAWLNMTYLALNLSHYVNGVAKLHAETSRKMFPGVPVLAITNGVHSSSWASPAIRDLYDRRIPGWREDNFGLRQAAGLAPEELWSAHATAKGELIGAVQKRTGLKFDPDTFTIGFARRFTGYKRADLLLHNLDRLREIVKSCGRIQIVYAGKAHPKDEGGKELIRRIFKAQKALKKTIPVVFLDNYDLDLARKMVSGVDLWLNTPQIPLEASGTSGMKAALNGVPSLSILDGWWVEGHIEGVTGWSIEELASATDCGPGATDGCKEAASIYSKLQNVILPMFYQRRIEYLNVMRGAMAINGPFFNTQRMVHQYITDAYLR